MARIVIALGGNALGETAEEQLRRAELAACAIVDLIEGGHEVVLVHGNGPQVGQIRVAFEDSRSLGHTPIIPFAECIAMSQGYIGYHLQQAIDEELVSRGLDDIPVITMLTQVVVDAEDPAFKNPTKPIGGYYDEASARKLMADTGEPYMEDAGRGWRRVVPSPKPVDIYEKVTLKTLLEAKNVIIAAGGGGIPVVYSGTRYRGVDAVIDKDFSAAKLAHLVEADVLLILTAVDHCYINFGTPEARALGSITVAEAQELIAQDMFASGSMLPKVEASCVFVSGREGRRAIIGALEKAQEAIAGACGTVISG